MLAVNPHCPARGGARSVQLEGGVKEWWTRITSSLHEMQYPGPKSGPGEQPVGVGGVNLLSPEESLPGSVPDIPSTASAGELLLSLFQAFLLLKSYHILPLMWLHSCGEWSDSHFWNDLGSFGRGAV